MYPSLQVQLASIESLGHEMLLYFQTSVTKLDVEEGYGELVNKDWLLPKGQPNSIFIARVPASRPLLGDSPIKLGVDLTKLYLFKADGSSIPRIFP